jgi:hypothetical protein
MKIFITGGTGFIGSNLVKVLSHKGHQISILTRQYISIGSQTSNINYIQSSPGKPYSWQAELINHDAVINLAGASIFQIWTKKARQQIRNSRINMTKNIVNTLQETNRDIHLINASAIGFYGTHDNDLILNEQAPSGNDFLASVCKDWESEALQAEKTGKKVTICRFGIVLGKDGGALKTMLPAFKLGAGSALGSGRQWFSWIHIEDLCEIICFLIENRHITGSINCTAPEPVRNREFSKALGKALNRPVILPAIPGFVIKPVLGELGDVILKGQRVIPEKLTTENYKFRYPALDQALQNLLKS